MTPDEKPPIAENEVPQKAVEPAQDVPLTKETAAAQLRLLAERTRAAGLDPLRLLAETYLERGRAIFAGLLASLESDDSSKKKEK